MKYFMLVMLFPLMGLAQILRPNLIINGDAVLDQRLSATVTIPAGNVGFEFGPDRWRGGNSSSVGVARIMQGTTAAGEAPHTLGLHHTIKYLVSTGFAPTGTEAASITHKVEGLNFYPYINKTMTYSFWVRSKKTGAFCTRFMNSAGDKTFTKQFTIASADTWQEMSVSINFKNSTGGTAWNESTGIGLYILHYLSLGSTVALNTDSTWANSGSVTSACRSNNLLGSIGDYVELTGVRLTEGAQKVPFVRAGGGDYGAELRLAQRYYEKSYPMDKTGGASTGLTTSDEHVLWTGTIPVTGALLASSIKFAVAKKPGMSTAGFKYWDAAGNASKVTGRTPAGAATNNLTAAGAAFTSNGAFLYMDSLGTYSGFEYLWTAESEL